MEMEANTNKETLVKDLHLEKSLDNDDSGAKSTERNKMADKLSMSESEGSDDYVHPLVSRRCAMDDPDQPREDHVIRNVSNVDRKSRDRSRTPRGSSENLLAQIKSDGKGIRKVKKKKIKHSEDGDGTISKEHSMKRRKIKIRKVKCKCNCLCAKHAKAKGQTSIDADGDKANKNQIKGNSKEDTTSVSVSDSLPSQDPNISVEPDLANTDSSKPEVPNKCTCTCSVSSKERKLCPRPDPEGGVSPVTSSHPDEYDAVINSSEPIFSDLEYDAKEDEEIKNELDRHHRRAQSDNIFSAAYLVTSNTMLKFAIIGAELQNIFRGALRRAEGEVGALTRRIRLLEEDFEQTETRLQSASEKLEEASKAADESERMSKALNSKLDIDAERIEQLEEGMKQAQESYAEADRRYQEVARKLVVTEAELERMEDRAVKGDAKVKALEEELHVVSNNLRSLEINDEKASQREDTYEETIRGLTQRLKDAENRAAEAERTVSKLQAEVDRLEDMLSEAQVKYSELKEEMERTLDEMQSL